MTQDERFAMIYDLTKHELEWLIENPDDVANVSVFFTDGGFNRYTDIELIRKHQIKFFD